MFGVIRIPDLVLQAALRHQPERANCPVAIIDGDAAAKATILQLTPAARAAGVNAGMTSTQGLARCRDLILLPRAPAQESAVAEVLLQTAFSCSPWVEATAPGVCTFELHGSFSTTEEALGQRVVSHLRSLDLEATLGFACNPDLALLAAHCAAPIRCAGSSAAFAEELPLSALGASRELVSILRKWGIHTAGGLTRLPQEQVTERLGSEAKKVWERAAGRATRLLELAITPTDYVETVEFENEIETLEPLLFMVRRFLEQLTLRLEAAHRVPEELGLELTLRNASCYRRQFRIPSPTSQVEVLFRIVHTHLENFTTESPICALRLTAIPAVPQTQQFGLFETALRDPNRFFETLARLNALLGPESAGTPVRADTHRPDSFHLAVPAFENLTSAAALEASAEAPAFGLPLRRFRPPLSAQVSLAQQTPAAIISAQITGHSLPGARPFPGFRHVVGCAALGKAGMGRAAFRWRHLSALV
jgi:protein ImuB